MTVQPDRSPARKRHFTRQHHDITMPKFSLHPNSICCCLQTSRPKHSCSTFPPERWWAWWERARRDRHLRSLLLSGSFCVCLFVFTFISRVRTFLSADRPRCSQAAQTVRAVPISWQTNVNNNKTRSSLLMYSSGIKHLLKYTLSWDVRSKNIHVCYCAVGEVNFNFNRIISI